MLTALTAVVQDIFDPSSATTQQILMKLNKNIFSMSFTAVCIFRIRQQIWPLWPLIGRYILNFSATAEWDLTILATKEALKVLLQSFYTSDLSRRIMAWCGRLVVRLWVSANLVNTIQAEPFQLGPSNLVHILLMTRGPHLLIFKVMGQRSRSHATHYKTL